MRAKKDRGETVAILEIFVLAFFGGILGLAMSAIAGALLVGRGKFEPDLHVGTNLIAYSICLAAGWGVGGIVGALAGVARLVQELLDLGHRASPPQSSTSM